MKQQSSYEELRLVSLLTQDSEYAFQLIFDRHRNAIYHLALRYLKSPAIAQEVVQDVFLKLWFSRKDLNADLAIEPWLFRVAKNHIINQLEKIANEWKAIDTLSKQKHSTECKLLDQLQDQYYSKLLHEAIAHLPEKQQQVFKMARQQGLSYLQIAEHLQISSLTVKTHMSRAIQGITAFFKRQGVTFGVAVILFPEIFF